MKQKIEVNTKGGLIAAFYCAIFTEWSEWSEWSMLRHHDLPPDTDIVLHRKTGTTYFHLKAAWSKDAARLIRGRIAAIRRIPAAQLLA